MAGGTWDNANKPIRPGMYINFEAAAQARLLMGSRGTVAIPLRANWGSSEDTFKFKSMTEVMNTFAKDSDAYTFIELAFLGGAKEVICARILDGNQSIAALTLKDSTNADALKLFTKYPTDRAFGVTVNENIKGDGSLDIKLFEGDKVIKVFSEIGSSADAVEKINSDSDNLWINAELAVDYSGGDTENLAVTASKTDFTGGNAGTGSITSDNYLDTLYMLETVDFDTFVSDTHDSDVLEVIVAWVNRVQSEGKRFTVIIGGTEVDDKTFSKAVARSKRLDNGAFLNIGFSGKLNGTWYPSYKIAAYIAGVLAGLKLKESLCRRAVAFEDVIPKLRNSEIVDSIINGVIVAVWDGEQYVIEEDRNTKTTLGEKENDAWKYAQSMRIMDAFNNDLYATANKYYVGKIPNDKNGQTALLDGFKTYLETMEKERVITDDYTVYLDPEKHGAGATDPAKFDEAFPVWEVTITSILKRIYGRVIVKNN